MTSRTIGVMVGAAFLSSVVPVYGASPPPADKVIVLVRANGCDMARLRPRLETAAGAMVRERGTTRVSIDWPADAERNLDLMGRPSPFAAALEVSAGRLAPNTVARRIQHGLGTDCHTEIYLVREHRLMTTPRNWQLDEPSPTSKTLVTLERKPGLSPEQFEHEWQVTHAKIAMGWRTARGGTGHYVQNLVVGRVGSGTPSLDGIGESEGPGGAPTPQEREARMKTAAHAQTFQNVASSAMFVARETILKDGKNP